MIIKLEYAEPKGRSVDWVEYITPEEAERRARKFDFHLSKAQGEAVVTMPLPPDGEFDPWEWDKVVREIHSETD